MTTTRTPPRARRGARFHATALIWLLAAAAAPAAAQTRLTLDEALRLAADNSETISIARAGESRADADRIRANAQRLPQVNFTGAYDRTLASEFSSVLDASGPPCSPLAVDASKPLADRIAEIERAAGCGGLGPSFDFANLPFGQRNVYRLSLSFAQPLYTGGRVAAQQRQADLGRRTAELATTSARASVALDVTRAFYDAALSDRLLAIAESGQAQAEAAYAQARQAFDAGRQPEFELLRAQVARDNQRPAVIRARANRDVAYLRLRQLLELPATAAVQVDVDLDAPSLPPPAPFADAFALVSAQGAGDRAVIRQAEALVQVREAAVAIAKAQRRPSIALSSSFGEVGYPSSGAFPMPGDFRTNWTVGAAVSMPIFTGRRLEADEQTARADLDDAQARLKQTRELAELDLETARQDLAAAEAVWQASAGTVQQAQRAYEIAELRYREGVSTQLELSDSRFSLQQAQANRAQAARDVQVARARLALLPDLPLVPR
jgi:outer membrane protein TolC